MNHLARFTRIRHTLAVISALRRVRQPFTTPQGLRQSLELLHQLGQSVGMQSRELLWLKKTVEEEEAFQVAWAIVQYLHGLVQQEQYDGQSICLTLRDGTQVRVAGQAFLRWLPSVAQLLSLLRQIRC